MASIDGVIFDLHIFLIFFLVSGMLISEERNLHERSNFPKRYN